MMFNITDIFGQIDRFWRFHHKGKYPELFSFKSSHLTGLSKAKRLSFARDFVKGAPFLRFAVLKPKSLQISRQLLLLLHRFYNGVSIL